MREDTIPPNWTYLVKSSPQSSAPEKIDLKDTWFNIDLEEDPKENTSHITRVAPENSRNVITQ